ncbi:MAG: PASTA domain-containing protein [Chitinophagaceae bacterium]|nr:PASTA domain-containing protein [Chitinophagaceae bacterium]
MPNNFLNFISSRKFLYNILGAIGFYIGVFLLFAVFVRSFTKHGVAITVPDLEGKSLEEAIKLLHKSDLEYAITDSTYDAKKPALSVIDQNPGAASKVKDGRTIYLTVNASMAPEVKMPDLKDASLKQATMILESYSMKVGRLIYKPDLAKNVVLDQQFEGKPILPGDFIRKGSVIDLVLGDGSGITELEIPDLVGMSLREAKFVLEGSSLGLRSVVYDKYVDEDSLEAIIYQQVPPAEEGSNLTLNAGDSVDVFVTSPDHYERLPD